MDADDADDVNLEAQALDIETQSFQNTQIDVGEIPSGETSVAGESDLDITGGQAGAIALATALATEVGLGLGLGAAIIASNIEESNGEQDSEPRRRHVNPALPILPEPILFRGIVGQPGLQRARARAGSTNAQRPSTSVHSAGSRKYPDRRPSYTRSVASSNSRDRYPNPGPQILYGDNEHSRFTADPLPIRSFSGSFRQESRLHSFKLVNDRLVDIIHDAETERRKCERRARMTGLALNIAIAAQVLISALITGLSASTGARRVRIFSANFEICLRLMTKLQGQIVIPILGGVATLVASYLARARGSNEPELNISRTKDLRRFKRKCRALSQDRGLEEGHIESVEELRNEFESLLGNADG